MSKYSNIGGGIRYGYGQEIDQFADLNNGMDMDPNDYGEVMDYYDEEGASGDTDFFA